MQNHIDVKVKWYKTKKKKTILLNYDVGGEYCVFCGLPNKSNNFFQSLVK